jgi:GT2 family glycosyltransferase
LPVLSGAAFFVRRAAFEAVGGFDPAIFLYHEDDDLSLRLKAECGRLMFIAGAQVTHQGGGSSVRSPDVAALKAWHMGRSRVYAMRRHDRPLAFVQALTSAVWQLMSPLLLLSRRKRAKQVAFLRGVWSARRLMPPKFESSS